MYIATPTRLCTLLHPHFYVHFYTHMCVASTLTVGDSCLAKFAEDELWYKATVVDTHGEDFLQLMYNDYGETTHAVERADVIPLDSQSGMLCVTAN